MLETSNLARKYTLECSFRKYTFFFNVVLILLPSLVTGPSFMSISSPLLELWQFSFIRDGPEIRKSEIPPSEFCPISGSWDELWIPNLTRVSLIEYYWLLQNSWVTAFSVFVLLKENQLEKGRAGGIIPPPRLGLNKTMKLVTPMISRNIFFRKVGDQSIQYSGSTNLTSHESLILKTNNLYCSEL